MWVLWVLETIYNMKFSEVAPMIFYLVLDILICIYMFILSFANKTRCIKKPHIFHVPKNYKNDSLEKLSGFLFFPSNYT